MFVKGKNGGNEEKFILFLFYCDEGKTVEMAQSLQLHHIIYKGLSIVVGAK